MNNAIHNLYICRKVKSLLDHIFCLWQIFIHNYIDDQARFIVSFINFYRILHAPLLTFHISFFFYTIFVLCFFRRNLFGFEVFRAPYYGLFMSLKHLNYYNKLWISIFYGNYLHERAILNYLYYQSLDDKSKVIKQVTRNFFLSFYFVTFVYPLPWIEHNREKCEAEVNRKQLM